MNDRKGRSLGSLESPSDGGARVLTAAQKAVISDLVMLPESSILFVKADGKEPGPHVAGAVERTGAVSCKCILLDFLAGAPCSDEKFVRLRVSHRAGLPNKAWCFSGRNSAQEQRRARAMLAHAALQLVCSWAGQMHAMAGPRGTGKCQFLVWNLAAPRIATPKVSCYLRPRPSAKAGGSALIAAAFRPALRMRSCRRPCRSSVDAKATEFGCTFFYVGRKLLASVPKYKEIWDLEPPVCPGCLCMHAGASVLTGQGLSNTGEVDGVKKPSASFSSSLANSTALAILMMSSTGNPLRGHWELFMHCPFAISRWIVSTSILDSPTEAI